MTRKRCALFLGLPLILSLGAFAWLTRNFWAAADMPELGELPAEYREEARELVREYGLLRPNRMTAAALWRCLSNPASDERKHLGPHIYAMVNEVPEVGVTRPRPRGTFWPDERQLIFYQDAQGCRVGVFEGRRLLEMKSLGKR
jgi:hypothetical protein